MSIQNKNTENITKWYENNSLVYSKLANKVETIIRELLEDEGATYYSISSRVKDKDSFIKKAQKDKYSDPINQIHDLAGIRIITYIRSEVTAACNIIKPLFNIDENNSIDKSNELGKDKVGYRSVHYIATLTEDRLNLPEYKLFKDLKFEIQIRTILEHAWADISHDRSYKFKGEFPPEYDIERRFSLASATLELVDREFDSIVDTLNKYETEIKDKTGKDLNLPINSATLNNYMLYKFNDQIKYDFMEPIINDHLVDELIDFGLNSIKELDEIIEKFTNKYPFLTKRGSTFIGLLRYTMMLTDIEMYFKYAWRKDWVMLSSNFYSLLESEGIDIEHYVKAYDLKIYSDYIEYK